MGEQFMRAWCLESRIGPPGLSLREVPDPVPAADEFLIEIEGSALNRADLLQTKGLYPAPEAEHEIPGLEFVGRILEIGAEAQLNFDSGPSVKTGDRVVGLVAAGAWAERIAVPGALLVPLPEDAAAGARGGIAECALTVFDALRLQGELSAGQDVLVHAGSSGIGTAALRIVHEYGARFLTTASSRKCGALRELGADLVVDYESSEFAEAVLEFTEGRGVDLILDTLGGEALGANLRCLKPRGTIVTIGLLAGARGDLDLGRLMMKRATLKGSVLRSRGIEEKAALVASFRRELGLAFAAGRLDPVVDSRFSFLHLPQGLERLRRRKHLGKILIDLESS
jgi:NADPH:quinone reductase-like Zn-dependent oxidoreductase